MVLFTQFKVLFVVASSLNQRKCKFGPDLTRTSNLHEFTKVINWMVENHQQTFLSHIIIKYVIKYDTIFCVQPPKQNWYVSSYHTYLSHPLNFTYLNFIQHKKTLSPTNQISATDDVTYSQTLNKCCTIFFVK